MQIRRVLLLIVCLISLTSITSFETKEEIEKRTKFYNQISQYSNGKLEAAYDPKSGFYCRAVDFITRGTPLMKIPIEYAMCPHFNFPFKFELTEWILNCKGLKETLGQEQKVSVYILVFQILYHLYANKPSVRQYIEENNLERYKNLNDYIEGLEDTFPKVVLGKSTLETSHFIYLNKKGLINETGQELELVFTDVMKQINQSPHVIAMYHWTQNFNRFKFAYGIVMSRSMTLRLPEYYKLVDYKEKSPRYQPHEVENVKINQKICESIGCPCIILFIDLCNHYQPKFRDMRDRSAIILDTDKNYFINTTPKTYDIGDEVSFTYNNDSTSLTIFMHYGFTIKNNVLNFLRFKIKDTYTLPLANFNLCKELGCVELSIKDPYSVPPEKFYNFYLNQINDQLLSLAKVRFLTEAEAKDSKTLKSIKTKVPVSFKNEIAAWIYYLNKLRFDTERIKPSYIDSIKETQHFRNELNQVEKKWKNDEEYRQNWLRIKQYEQIAELDISYKKVAINNLIGVKKQIIKVLHEDIQSIKSKMIQN